MFSLLIASLFSTLVFAAPVARTNCDIRDAQLVLPSYQTALTLPPQSTPSYIAAAFGVQNYTCDPISQTYKSVGAVAELFDISCLYGTPQFSTIQDTFYMAWSNPSNVTIQDMITLLSGRPAAVLGQHYFISDPDNSLALVPIWDFTTSAIQEPNENAYVIGATTGDLPAPTGPDDVDWLSLENIQGELADYIYRVDTISGRPPTSCTFGPPQLSVKYSSKYWFYGGSVKEQYGSF